ncbi:MAG: hypothetical protein Q4D29_11610 [Lachnospiraceae bacterium]|nr:hypothetical protein [Lachnospiraceae bacterium]
MCRFKKSGEVTVFLSLLCLVICGLIAATVKSARISYLKNSIENITDISLKSAMSEYNKPLFDKYGLLYVDTTYKGVLDGGDESFINHLSQYMDANLKGYSSGNEQLYYISSEVESSEYANSNDYESVFSQIISYMTNVKGMSASLSDKEIVKEYLYLMFPDELDYINAEELEDEVNDMTYDELRDYCIHLIRKNMRENSYEEFDFNNLLSDISVTVYTKTSTGKIYECTKSYSLN